MSDLASNLQQIEDLVSNFAAIQGEDKGSLLLTVLMAVQQIERQHNLIVKMAPLKPELAFTLMHLKESNAQICMRLITQSLAHWPENVRREGLKVAAEVDKLVRRMDVC